ncbi:SMEK domain-containing protein [Burkholderia cepacia]|uniref:SMEK domain-containing protein n=1 Tax=Burkholderia cepacia TaxID=292 RepID=UPI001CF2E5C4|nr:SMEK domain-containing protein [Burkholderia cepacia]ELW9532218.1 SMEK domain-containing protein [Burkholderia cenocepacia]MCA8031103.1 SMEK domain-containing protein [Burkholderia cepacia]
MLTRGHLIGQIVDDLAGIAAQAKQRARLHLFDIHTHVEDFAREVLNRALELGLSNLNTEHSNNPGLDLGDASNGWAFQVTADKSGTKVKETLEAISDEQRAKYHTIRVLVIGEKQGSYSFTGQPYQKFSFTPDMVWDFNDVCKQIMTLPIDTLVDLASYISRETRRVRIELEIPDEDGKYPSNIDDLIESLPRPQLSNAGKMEAYFDGKGIPIEREQAEKAIAELSAKLAGLPRLTREVFKFLMERRDERTVGMFDSFRISDPKLRRIYHGDDLDGDLALLTEAGLLSINEPDEPGEAYYWRIHFPGYKDHFHSNFADFARELGIDLRKPLVMLDFSSF